MQTPDIWQRKDDENQIGDDVWNTSTHVERFLVNTLGGESEFEVPAPGYGGTIKYNNENLPKLSQSLCPQSVHALTHDCYPPRNDYPSDNHNGVTTFVIHAEESPVQGNDRKLNKHHTWSV